MNRDNNNEQIRNDAERMKRMNFSEDGEQSKENPIRATDQSRIAERDERIENEEDTERLKSERQSAQEGKAK